MTSAQSPIPSLGYATPMARGAPPRRLWPVVAALATGVLLLAIALFALKFVVETLAAPKTSELPRELREVFLPIVCVFAGLCTVAAFVFLGVGLKWLGGVSRIES
jgi:hypothetical protein